MPSQTDVLIVGAGAAGLTLAVELARRGVDFRLVDKAEGPFEGSRGKGIQPRSQEVFEAMGVLHHLLALGAAPYPVIRTYDAEGGHSDQPLDEARAPTIAEPFAGPLMLPQMLTERALRTRLAELGAAPRYGCALIDFMDEGELVTARLQTPEGLQSVRARWLIGADGGRSTVRRALGIDFPGQTLPIRALVADLEVENLARDAWHRWAPAAEGQLSLCPLAGTDLFQLQAVLQPEDEAEGEASLSDEAIAAMIARRTGRNDLHVHNIGWRSAFGMNARLAERYRVGRVLLVGDAGHVHPPTGGQGLNTSVQDAYNLGWKLAAVLAGAPEVLVDTYEAERRSVAAGVLGLSQKLLGQAASGAAMRRGREAHQLDLGYAGSSLALDLRPEPHPEFWPLIAGDRAPDAWLDGRRLFQRFTTAGWLLIGWQVGEAEIAARPGLTVLHNPDSPDGSFDAGYFLAPGTWLLIRPDGYVGAVAPTGEKTALERYLSAALAPG